MIDPEGKALLMESAHVIEELREEKEELIKALEDCAEELHECWRDIVKPTPMEHCEWLGYTNAIELIRRLKGIRRRK